MTGEIESDELKGSWLQKDYCVFIHASEVIYTAQDNVCIIVLRVIR